MIWASIYLFIFSLSGILTWLLRRYALKISLLDVPNHRSSHRVPTPKGGGVAFVLSYLLAGFILFCLKQISLQIFLILLACGTVIALIGFIDDRRSIPAKWRLLFHFFICAISLYLLGGMPDIYFLHWWLPSGLIANLLALFYLVWLLNLYNFMDGIDGLAAVEAITVSLGGALLYFLHGHTMALFLPLGLAIAVAGFLIWNFPPARIFMGDVGSGFLGFFLGILSIQAAIINPQYFWSWLIFLAVFIVDATLTLFNRLASKQQLFEAHCTHAYQHASRYYGEHRPVTLGVIFINLLWLFPWALLVGNGSINGVLGVIFAYAPLFLFALKFNAGKNALVS